MTRSPTLFVLDDDPAVVEWLVEMLTELGYQTVGETSALRALDFLRTRRVDLMISDVEMPELRGLDFLAAVHREQPAQLVLLMTAFGSIDLAVECVRKGAVDFLAKPFRIEALTSAIQRALRERQMRHEVVRLRAAMSESTEPRLRFRSPGMNKALELARRAARSDLPVLITGESGVGKGVLARVVHDASPRSSKPYVQLNCATLPAGLAESELFGVRKGAFTDAREDRPGVFEQAHEGTLFLDEIGELPLEAQPKLLQALEVRAVRPLGGSREVLADARIIAATNRSLEGAIREQRFRPDLYHRLNVVRIEVPPLRERPEDIDAIVDQALADLATRSELVPLGVSADAMRFLRARSWPGNVRELVNAVQRAVALTEHDVLRIEDFEQDIAVSDAGDLLEDALAREMSLADLERAYLTKVLAKTGGHKGNAAKILQVDRRTLYRKLAELDVVTDRPPSVPPTRKG